jgi:hypothetical protein
MSLQMKTKKLGTATDDSKIKEIAFDVDTSSVLSNHINQFVKEITKESKPRSRKEEIKTKPKVSSMKRKFNTLSTQELDNCADDAALLLNLFRNKKTNSSTISDDLATTATTTTMTTSSSTNRIDPKNANYKRLVSYRGISKAKMKCRWTARIEVDKTMYNLGTYKTKKRAAQIYDLAAYHIWGDEAILNFDTKTCRKTGTDAQILDFLDTFTLDSVRAAATDEAMIASTYNGVYRFNGDDRWGVKYSYKGKDYFVTGDFASEIEAAKAYDYAIGELEVSPRYFKSKYRGVAYTPQYPHWNVNIYYKGMRHSLGMFETQLEAAKAYDMHAKELKGKKAQLNFPDETVAAKAYDEAAEHLKRKKAKLNFPDEYDCNE